jgi:outer membrane receptor protein involved in Fe transport
MKRVFAIFVFAALLGGGFAGAQETTGSVFGTITSEDGATMPGVTVTISDPDTGFERTTVTNTAGEFRFVALQPATYGLQATLDGFQTYQRNIAVDLGRTVKNDFTMTLGAITDVIEVTGEAPLVDVTSTVTGMTVNQEELSGRLPVGRESTQIALLAPSTSEGDRRFDSDYTPGQQLVAISGSSPAENAYQVNGLNITNFRNMLGSSFVPFEFVEEVQVKSGGYEAEFGRSTGGVINMVTKSGTNSLNGGVSAYYSPESLQETEPDSFNRDNEEEFFESLEANASLGGAVVRDRLFFFGFIRWDDTEFMHNVGFRNTVTQNEAPYYGAKVDWNITPNHRLEGTYLVDDTQLGTTTYEYDRDTRTQGAFVGTGEQSRGGDNYIGKYTGIFTENFLLSAQYGNNQFDRTDSSSNDDCHYAFDARSGTTQRIGCWVNWQVVSGGDERDAYRVDADWYLGNHSVRGGADYETNSSTEEGMYSGGSRFIYYNNGDRFPQYGEDVDLIQRRTRTTGGTFDVDSNAVYVQDSWAISPELTFNFGVRWESYENYNAAGDTFIKIDDQYAPRLGLIWDPSGQGRTKLFASFGQYHLPIAANTNIRLAGLEYDSTDWFVFPDGATINPNGSPSEFGEFIQNDLASDGEVPDANSVRATNLDPMSQNEFILGAEQMLGSDWSVGGRVVFREFNEVIEDLTIDAALADEYPEIGLGAYAYYLANPGSDFEGFYDFNGDGVIDEATEAVSFTADQLGYPDAERKYYAVELTAKRRFADNWMTQIAYTWSQSYGNYEGYVKSDIGQDDAGLTQDFDFPGLMDNAYGFLPNDRRHNLKVFGAYAWDMGLQIGGYVYYQTGRPQNAISLHPTDVWAQEYGAASFFYADGTPAPRGSVGTTDDLYGLDAMVKYDFQMAGLDWNVRLDVFNLFDFNAVTYYSETAGTASGTPDDSFQQPIYQQTPRRVRFGVGLNF